MSFFVQCGRFTRVIELRSRLDAVLFFFFNDTATTEIYTLSLHDALPICEGARAGVAAAVARCAGHRGRAEREREAAGRDRKSTRLNSSHLVISYAVFCLKKKKQQNGVEFSCRPGAR